MTLCTAWIREKTSPNELVFATDSSLTGGEKWNHGIKLFELPRTDCLLCFAGNTDRAYPLILNLIASIKLDARLQSPRTDISEVLNYLAALFTELVEAIKNEVQGQDIHELREGAEFIFGGWSWQQSRFRIWELKYTRDAEGFVHEEISDNPNRARTYQFLGNPNELAEDAKKRLRALQEERDSFDDKLDHEPLEVLIQMSLDKTIREVDGSIQIGKVYMSGTSEFFGIQWPSVKGNPHFQGRQFCENNKPPARYYDPDTLEIVEDQLPEFVPNHDLWDHLTDTDQEFIRNCYNMDGPNLNLTLKETLSDGDRLRLLGLFKSVAYTHFLNPKEEAENQ